MLHKYLLIPAVLAIGGLLMVDSAQAASRGARGGGGRAAVGRSSGGGSRGGYARGSYGGGYGRGYYGGGYGRGYYGGGYGRGYYGGGYGLGDYGGGYYGGWPYYGAWGGGYWPGYYSSYQPYWDNSYPYVDTYPYSTSNYAPVMPYYGQAAPGYLPPSAANGTASVEVILPDPQARVLFDGALTRETGTDRVFTTPPLTASGTYRIEASWTVAGQTVTQDRVISVAPNQMTVVDFTRPVGG